MMTAEDILARHARMKQVRAPYDSLRQECADLLLPRQSNFNLSTYSTSPNNLEPRIFDEYAQQALEQGVSIFEGYVMPRGQIWQRWELADADLMKRQAVRAWCEAKNMELFRMRNDPKSGFTGQVHESVASLFAFGMQSMWVDKRYDVAGQVIGLSYQSEFVDTIYVERNFEGLVTRVHARLLIKAEDALRRWPETAPECARKAVRDKQGDRKFEFIHAIGPNEGYDPQRMDAKGKPWLGVYLNVDDKVIVQEGGYHSQPRIVSAFSRAPQEDYGRCPAFTVLPAIRATQQMMLDLMQASELKAMPPMGAHTDMLDQTIRYAAREVTYGAIDARGNRRLVPLIEGADMSDAMGLLDKLHGHIDRAFFVDMLQIRNDMKSHVTDSQLYQREEEKGLLLAPLANQETEWLTVMLDRELSLMDDMSLLDDMPGEVAEAMDAGVGLKVIYDNGLTRAQEAGSAAGYFRLLEQLGPIFQSDQAAWQTFQQKYPLAKVLDNLGRINGVPAAWEATDEERDAKREADDQAAADRQLLDALPAIGKAANDLSGAMPGGMGLINAA